CAFVGGPFAAQAAGGSGVPGGSDPLAAALGDVRVDLGEESALAHRAPLVIAAREWRVPCTFAPQSRHRYSRYVICWASFVPFTSSRSPQHWLQVGRSSAVPMTLCGCDGIQPRRRSTNSREAW